MMKIILIIMSMNLLTIMINKNFLNTLIINLMFMLNLMFLLNNYMNYYWMKINYIMGMDFLSFSLSFLTLWIIPLSMYSNNNFMLKKFNINFLNIMIIMLNILILCFWSINLMMFYIMFETSLIPIMLIIMGWGYQIDRIQASMYMLFYTLFGSLPLLMILMYLYNNNYTLMMNIMHIKFMNLNNFIIYMMLTLAFLIKMPMFMTHLWLPKAHVEAPISGSMILAGIMLKLGSYGLYRMMLMFPKLFMNNNSYLIMFSLIGSLLSSLICLNQTDLKIIVAYSSVVHMNLMMSSMMIMFNMSFSGSLLMMISHGLCSCGMFFIVNLNYERMFSRNMLINKGLINIMPSLTLWWFLLMSSNFSAPPSLNLISEILLFNSLIQWNNIIMMIILFISFFSTCYSIFMYSFTQYGKINYMFYNFKNINKREYLMIMLMWIPLNILFLNLNLLL
uniref:NADH-ubiquinone oxidoreductase chain 4 n=1 Tax=Acanthormius sp. QL-2013 TaxID=1421592 RepID=A0A0A6ZKM1_9HYME|nr:NADH dehydrogenase subunit 4 [Acanthormius sp. QL-2013]